MVDAAVFHPRKVTHVALVAEDFEGMFDYYVDIIGLEALTGSRTAASAVLRGTASDGDVTLYRKARRPCGRAAPRRLRGLERGAICKRSIAALPGKGLEVEREIDHPARHSIMIRDPDGLRLQFFVNRDWAPPAIAKAAQDEALYLL